jgi:hypothetical protein
MNASTVRLSGDEWQVWANQLLSCRYGPSEYQKVPDHDRGDAGIEGFTITDGHAYQAYGCEEPLLTGERYKKQRVKMTTDIGKFIDNRELLCRIFGHVRITRWSLFVPLCDSKELVVHASKKTEEVLARSLPYVGDGFRVIVCDEEQFSVERDMLLNAHARTLDVEVDEATDDQVAEWADTHNPLVATLDQKIACLPTITCNETRIEFRNRVVKWFLEGQGILDALRRYPDAYEKVVRAKAHREKYLIRTCTLGQGSPSDIFTQALDDYLATVEKEAYMLSGFTTESLAYEAVADWMLRCPLSFPNRALS